MSLSYEAKTGAKLVITDSVIGTLLSWDLANNCIIYAFLCAGWEGHVPWN